MRSIILVLWLAPTANAIPFRSDNPPTSGAAITPLSSTSTTMAWGNSATRSTGTATGALTLAAGAGLTAYNLITSSTSMPSIVCNAGTPLLAADSGSMSGAFTAGIAAVSCTVTFTTTWPKAPRCWCNDQTTPVALAATATTSTLICTAVGALTGDTITYGCLGVP